MQSAIGRQRPIDRNTAEILPRGVRQARPSAAPIAAAAFEPRSCERPPDRLENRDAQDRGQRTTGAWRSNAPRRRALARLAVPTLAASGPTLYCGGGVKRHAHTARSRIGCRHDRHHRAGGRCPRRDAARAPRASFRSTSRSPAGWSTTRTRSGRAPEPCCARCTPRASSAPRGAIALGITNQRETAVLWDRATGAPVGRAIVWQDRRTADLCARWRAAGLEPRCAQRTGLVLDPYFSASKLRWWLGRTELASATALRLRHRRRVAVVEAYRRHAVHATDPTNASRTLLFDIHARRWDDDAAARLRRAARLAARGAAVGRRLRRDARRARRCRTASDRRHRGRPAGRALRPGLLRSPASGRTPTAPAASWCCNTGATAVARGTGC